MGLALAAGLAVAIALASALWLARPWWSRGPGTELHRRQANVVGYRQRLTEIDEEVSAGLLAPEAAETLRREAGARLLADTGDATPPRAGRPLPAGATIVLVLLPIVFAAGAYYAQGSWRTQALIARAAQDPQGAERAALEDLTRRLAGDLEDDPDDAQHWAALGQALFLLERYPEAAQAWNRVNALSGGDDPDALVQEGEALALAAGRNLQGRPRELFERALALAPGHPRALWYAGIAAAHAGDTATAARHWRTLLQQDPPPALRRVLETQLAALGEAGSDTAQSMPASSLTLRLRVDVAPGLAEAVPAGATLFVFARAADGAPLPLAVWRGVASDLPVDVTLSDENAMSPAFRLSQFDEWIVTARISASGTPQAQPGDLQGQLRLSRADAASPLALTIDALVDQAPEQNRP